MRDPYPIHLVIPFAIAAGGYVISALFVPRVLLRKREPSATLAWLVVILVFPYVGVFLYTVLGNNRVKSRHATKRRSDEQLLAAARPLWASELVPLPPFEAPRHPAVLSVASRLGLAPPTGGNAARLYEDGPSAFGALLAAIAGARHHLHLEFFLFRHDQTGRRVLEALAEAARRGVEVRLLVDSVGQFMTRTPDSFFDLLREAGGRVVRFLPVGLVWGWSFFNLRNHRKLVLADGRVAFTGGMNVGDEYAGLKGRAGPPWRDLLLRVEGPAAGALQEVFACDWFFATGENLADPAYFPRPAAAGEEFVQVLTSGPDDSLQALHRLTLSLLEAAQERISITTPYFVPDPTLASAIELASLRGVDVRVIVPERSNHPLVRWAGRSFYEEMLAAGVQIFEYAGGILHAKALVVDGQMCAMGSANMDVRSFRLNFELNLLLYGKSLPGQLEKVFVRDQASSRRVDPGSFGSRPLREQVAETAARILSPVL